MGTPAWAAGAAADRKEAPGPSRPPRGESPLKTGPRAVLRREAAANGAAGPPAEVAGPESLPAGAPPPTPDVLRNGPVRLCAGPALIAIGAQGPIVAAGQQKRASLSKRIPLPT